MILNKRPALILGILWLATISVLFALPGTAFPKNDIFADIQFDKWVHFGFFALLLFLWCKGLGLVKKTSLYVIFGVAVLYGLLVEIAQDQLIINRSFDLGDLAADSVGAIAGIWFYSRYIKK